MKLNLIKKMNRLTYDKIVEFINTKPNLNRQEIFDQINQHLTCQNEKAIKFETFTSIYGTLKRRQMFKSTSSNQLNWKKLKDNSINLCIKYKQYETDPYFNNQNILLIMSNDLCISPVLICRLVLDGLIRTNQLEINTETLLNTKLIKDKLSISNLIKETHLIKNGRLAAEILSCCSLDDDYGPSIDLIKNLIGLEYEMKLEHILVNSNISFIREDELREKGFDKTPDFKLDIPIYLKSNGACINWIDSKATFGDQQSHTEYYESQFKFYINRFGPGLVIYWFGYLNDLDKLYQNSSNNSSSSSSITICDYFPTNDLTILNINSLI